MIKRIPKIWVAIPEFPAVDLCMYQDGKSFKTTISSDNFITQRTASSHLTALEIERYGNITEDGILRTKSTLQTFFMRHENFYNSQFGVLAISCFCSCVCEEIPVSGKWRAATKCRQMSFIAVAFYIEVL